MDIRQVQGSGPNVQMFISRPVSSSLTLWLIFGNCLRNMSPTGKERNVPISIIVVPMCFSGLCIVLSTFKLPENTYSF